VHTDPFKSGQAPAIDRILPDHSTRQVKFDGVDGDVMVDRKIAVLTNQIAKD
jgi:filamentous hemagglutinin